VESSAARLTNACSSATKDVVMFSNGTLNNFDTKLKTETDTPTAANSTDPTPEQKQVILYSMDGKYDTNIAHKNDCPKSEPKQKYLNGQQRQCQPTTQSGQSLLSFCKTTDPIVNLNLIKLKRKGHFVKRYQLLSLISF
jgi:hypothetical protein